MGKLLKSLSVRARISGAFALVLLIFAGVSGSSTFALFRADTLFGEYRAVAIASAALMEMRGDFYSARVAAAGYAQDRAPSDAAETQAMIKSSLDAYARIRQRIVDPELLALVDGLRDGITAFEAHFNQIRASGESGEAVVERLDQLGSAATKMISDAAASADAKRDQIGPVVDNTLKNAEVVSIWTTSIGLLVSMALAFFLARSIVTPVTSITAAMKRVSDGDLATEIPARDRRDEIGAMAAALAVFRDALARNREMEQAARMQEEEAQAEKRRTMEALANDFEAKVGTLVRQLSAAADEMETAARSMSSNAEQTNQQSGMVAAAAEETSANVQAVATATEELSVSASEIGGQVTQSSDIAARAVGDARRTNEKVQDLAQGAAKIGDVVKLISDIAEQTNLLALNATIEAARAGEAGRGFAVVASEVKELASQTSRATEDIAGQIAAIQNSTSDVVEAIQSIGTTIEDMHRIAASVAAAVEQQQAATSEIARNVNEAARGTQEVTENITQVREAATHTGAAAAQVLTAANGLAKNAGEMNRELGAFLNGIRTA